MSSTLEAPVFIGKKQSDNLHSIKNTEDLTMKQMFDISEKLIAGQSDEIYGVKTMNWEDSSWKHLSLIGDDRERHPNVADMIIEALELGPHTPTLVAVAESAHDVLKVQGFEPPSWRELSHGARPPLRESDDHEPGGTRRECQHEAASRVERQHREVDILPRLTDSEKTSLRSQSGPGAASALSAVSSCDLFRISPHLFRVLLLRRLRLALPPVSRSCSQWRVPERGFVVK